MILIATKETVERHIPIAKGCTKNIEFYLLEEQNTTLRDWLGQCFFSEMETKHSEADFQILLSGGEYSINNKKYYCDGLEKVLSYLGYAEYVLLNNYTDTPFGVKIKNFEDGLPTPPETLEKLRVIYRNKAISFFESCKLFLCNKKNYFCYNGDCSDYCGDEDEDKTNPRIRVKGRTLYGSSHEKGCGCHKCKEYTTQE